MEVSGPARMPAGGTFVVLARVRNTGAWLWESGGARRTEVIAMVVDANGSPWTGQPAPARLPYPTPAGGATTVPVQARAPDLPGRYVLLLGLQHRDAGKAVLDPAPVARWEFEVMPPGR